MDGPSNAQAGESDPGPFPGREREEVDMAWALGNTYFNVLLQGDRTLCLRGVSCPSYYKRTIEWWCHTGKQNKGN